MGAGHVRRGFVVGDLWTLTGSGGCARKVPAEVSLDFARVAGCGGGALFMNDVGYGRVGDETICLTVDFITPVVPDPVDYGQIAAANALSDVYAAGMLPRFALAIACVPEGDATRSFRRYAADLAAAIALHLTRGRSQESEQGIAASVVTRTWDDVYHGMRETYARLAAAR